MRRERTWTSTTHRGLGAGDDGHVILFRSLSDGGRPYGPGHAAVDGDTETHQPGKLGKVRVETADHKEEHKNLGDVAGIQKRVYGSYSRIPVAIVVVEHFQGTDQ